MNCQHCGSKKTQKNGTTKGRQRCKCKECGRTFTAEPPKFNAEDKRKALLMYLNNCGIRKTALFLGASRTTVSNWIKEAHKKLPELMEKEEPEISGNADIIELDEIYTFVQKNRTEHPYGLLFLEKKAALLRLK